MISISILIVISLAPAANVIHSALAQPITATTTLSIVSSRGQFNLDTGSLKPQYTKTNYTHANVPGLDGGSKCPPQLAVYIHGVWTNEKEANEQLDRLKMSLIVDKYNIAVAGFTWDSNTDIGETGWQIAKNIADGNGPKLAHFIFDFMNKCANTQSKIRLVAHSLGAAVVRSTLISLDKNQTWNNRGFKIASVNLLGAAIDRDSPDVNGAFGQAIEHTTDKFYNLYDPRDVMLMVDYTTSEPQDALGLTGADSSIWPTNYTDQDVSSTKMQYQDANGTAQPDCLDYMVPWFVSPLGVVVQTDNHCGYMGFRDPFNWGLLRSDGAIGTIVTDWRLQ